MKLHIKFNQGWESSEYAVIVYGLDYPDALCATPAAKYNAPIILAQIKVNRATRSVNILKEKVLSKYLLLVELNNSSFEGDLKLGISQRLGKR